MSNREDYEWRRKVSAQDFGCLGVIGLSVIVCTGVVKYGVDWERYSVDEKVGENLYVFVCHEPDRKNHNCETEEHLWAVYEKTSRIKDWQEAPVSWIGDPSDTERCSWNSYKLDQCYDLAPNRAEFYQAFLEEKLKEKQHE